MCCSLSQMTKKLKTFAGCQGNQSIASHQVRCTHFRVDNLAENNYKKLSEQYANIKKLLDSRTMEQLPDYDNFTKEEKIDLIRQMIEKIVVWKDGYYSSHAEVYTKVDHFLYTFDMNTYTKEVSMRSQIII